MRFNLINSKISSDLYAFACQKMKEENMQFSRATSKHLKGYLKVVKEIERTGLPSYLVLKKLKKKLGYGIFLDPKANPILRGEVIGPYTGDIYVAPQNHGKGSDYAFSLLSDLILTKEQQKKWDPERSYHPRRLYSLDLDADQRGNFTRFINHSVSPNVEARLAQIKPNDLGIEPLFFSMFYIAKKTIYPGEQLLVCYEGDDKSYWGPLGIKPFPMTPQTFRLSSRSRFL